MTIEELNASQADGTFDELVRVEEARQVKALSRVADAICAREGVRLVLVAGGSSAGKTTTAKRLATQLRVNGRAALHVSTDDYFVGDARNPRDENGDFDYETVECVDMPRLAEDVNALLAGRPTRQRRFDFMRHEGYDADAETTLAPGGCIVLEGIHALNPRLTDGIPDACKYRVFVEPKNQPQIFAMTTFSPTDGRFLRRLVRDNQFRKMSPVDTFTMWPKVLAGEEKWILPFRRFADVEFDSGLPYELAVLKPYAGGLLQVAKRRLPDAPRIDLYLELFAAVTAASPVAVPGDSVLRETIGGSQLEY